MTEGRFHFELDGERTERDGKPRTTRESVDDSIAVMRAAGHLATLDLEKQYKIVLKGEEFEGTIPELTTLCNPDHLNSGGMDGFKMWVGVVGLPPKPSVS